MSSTPNTNANRFMQPLVSNNLPTSAPFFGKRGTFAAFGNADPGGSLMKYGRGGSNHIRGFDAQSMSNTSMDAALSALNSTSISQASTGLATAVVDPIIKFSLWVPPDHTEDNPRFEKVRSVNDLWTAERIVIALDATLMESSQSESQRKLANYALGKPVNGHTASRIRGGAYGAPSSATVAGTSKVAPYSHALTPTRANVLLATLLAPDRPVHPDTGAAWPERPYPHVSRIVNPLHIIGVSNNEMSTRDDRGPFARQFVAENKVLNIQARGKTAMYSPMGAASYSPFSSIYIFAEYEDIPSSYQMDPDRPYEMPLEPSDIEDNKKVVQYRSWTRDHSNPKAWTLPSLEETRSIDAHGAVQLSQKIHFGNFNYARRYKPKRQGGLPTSYIASEYLTSNSSLINVDINPTLVK